MVGRTTPALLLGPLAVDRNFRRWGVAASLVGHGLAAARRHGHRIVVAIGEPAMFAHFGFAPAHEHGLTMPVPVETARFLTCPLTPGALDGVSGVLGPAASADASPVRALRRAM